MPDLFDQVMREMDQAKRGRSLWNVHWDEIATLMLPSMAEFLATAQPAGGKRMSKIIESSALLALGRFASSIHQFLSGEGETWFVLETEDQRLNEDYQVRMWLEDVGRRMMAVFNDPSRGYHTCQRQVYLQIGAFGTGPKYIGEAPDGPYFQGVYLGQIYLMVDDRYRVVGVLREYTASPMQLMTQFPGFPMPKIVQDAYEANPAGETTTSKNIFTMVHSVRPRPEADRRGFGAQAMPFQSVYALKEAKQIMGIPSGYMENPYIVSRWDRAPTEIYGRGPGMNALPDVKMTQEFQRSWIKAIHKIVDPPLIVDDEGTLRPRINTAPGKVTYARRDQNGKMNVEYMTPPVGIENADKMRADLQRIIDKHFFLDVFKSPGPVSADGAVTHMSMTEFAAHKREQLQDIGPMISQEREEDLVPTIKRTFQAMVRAGMIPPPPALLIQHVQRGGKLLPKYVSPAGVAQQAMVVNTIAQAFGYLQPMLQLDPSVADAVDIPGSVQELLKGLRFPMKGMATPEAIAGKVQRRQQQQDQQLNAQNQLASAQAANQGAQAVSTLRGTNG